MSAELRVLTFKRGAQQPDVPANPLHTAIDEMAARLKRLTLTSTVAVNSVLTIVDQIAGDYGV